MQDLIKLSLSVHKIKLLSSSVDVFSKWSQILNLADCRYSYEFVLALVVDLPELSNTK